MERIKFARFSYSIIQKKIYFPDKLFFTQNKMSILLSEGNPQLLIEDKIQSANMHVKRIMQLDSRTNGYFYIFTIYDIFDKKIIKH